MHPNPHRRNSNRRQQKTPIHQEQLQLTLTSSRTKSHLLFGSTSLKMRMVKPSAILRDVPLSIRLLMVLQRQCADTRLRPDCAENLLFLHHNMVRFEQYEKEEEDAIKAEKEKRIYFGSSKIRHQPTERNRRLKRTCWMMMRSCHRLLNSKSN